MLKACFRLSRTFWRLDGVRNLWIFRLFAKGSKWQNPCHTERSEVSINLKREFAYLRRGYFALNLKYVLNFVDISLTLNMTIWIFRSFYSLKMTSDVDFSPFYKRLKMTKFRRHCERARRVWQSTKDWESNLSIFFYALIFCHTYKSC